MLSTFSSSMTAEMTSFWTPNATATSLWASPHTKPSISIYSRQVDIEGARTSEILGEHTVL